MIDVVDDRSERGLHSRGIARARIAASLFGRQTPSAGRFVIGESLGSGAMGTVYASYDDELDRPVAIKILHRDVSDHARVRVRREARALARLDHPNIVSVYEIGDADGTIFIVMQRLRGPTLAAWQSEAGRTNEEILAVYRGIGAGLAAAHAAGVVHRDFKPANVIVETHHGRPEPRIVDFGLARRSLESVEEDFAGTEPELRDDADAELTATGAIVGTPAYMAPEQHLGGDVGAAADQFAFCVCLFEALWGHRPFPGDRRIAVLHSIQEGRIDRTRERGPVPRPLEQVILRGLRLDPMDRFPSMRSLLDAIDDGTRPRGRRYAAVLGAVGIVSLAWSMTAADGPSDPCADSDAVLTGIWDDERRAQVEGELGESEAKFVRDTWARVAGTLDAYAGRYVAEHRAACEDTLVDERQSKATMQRRRACLEETKAELAAAVDLLESADEATLARLDMVVDELADPSACSDVEHLADAHAIAVAGERDAVESVVRELARARSLRRVGKAAAAVTIARDARRHAAPLVSAIHASVELELGRCLDEAGEYEEAETVFDEALRTATARGQSALQHDATIGKLWVVGFRQRRFAEALALRSLAEGLSRTPRQRALLHVRLGRILHLQGNPREAEAEYRAALLQWGTADGDVRLQVARTKTNLSESLGAQGRTDEAIEEQTKALDVLVQVLGAAHPEVALARAGLGEALRSAGQYPRALTEQRDALAQFVAAYGEDHPETSTLRTALGSTLYVTGDYAAAERMHRRALLTHARTHGEQHPAAASLHNNLAAALFAQGKLEEAASELRAAIALKEHALGPDHPSLARSRDNLGATLRAQGDLDAALAEHEAALQVRRRALGDDHPELALSFNNLAAVWQFKGDFERAARLYRDALRQTVAARGQTHPETAKVQVNLGTVLLRLDRFEEAEPLFRHALRSRSSSLDAGHPEIAEAKLGLGRARLARGDRREALALLESAHAIFDGADDIPAVAKAEAKVWLARALGSEPGQLRQARELAREALAIYEADASPDESAIASIRAWLASHR